jgi:hypothetical protein
MKLNTAVRTLTRAYDGVRETPTAKVTISAQTAAEVLDYIQELESQIPEKLKLGDTVEVTTPGSYKGLKGTIINVEPLARRFPYSVEIKAPYGQGKTIVYFSQSDIRKAV